MTREYDPKRADEDANYKIFQLLVAGLAGADSAKNKVFAGKKGSDKVKATDFKDAQSIIDNQIEGTDVMENFGMEPGELKTYLAGLAWDTASAPTMGLAYLSKLAKAGKLAKAASVLDNLPTGTNIARKGGEMLEKKGVKSWISQTLPVNEVNKAKVDNLAKHVDETKLTKLLRKPQEGVKFLKGEEKMIRKGSDPFTADVKEKVTKGRLDHHGENIHKVLSEIEDVKISRGEMFDELSNARKARNDDELVLGTKNMEQEDDNVKKLFKPFKEEEVEIPAIPVEKPQLLAKEDDTLANSWLMTAEEKLQKVKAAKAETEAKRIARERAEREAQKEVKTKANQAQTIKSKEQIAKERLEAERAKIDELNEKLKKKTVDTNKGKVIKENKSLEAENKRILAHNKKINAEIAELERQAGLPKEKRNLGLVGDLSPAQIRKVAEDKRKFELLDQNVPKDVNSLDEEELLSGFTPKQKPEFDGTEFVLTPEMEDLLGVTHDDIVRMAKQRAESKVPEFDTIFDDTGLEEAIAKHQEAKNYKLGIDRTNKDIDVKNYRSQKEYEEALAKSRPTRVKQTVPTISTPRELQIVKEQIHEALAKLKAFDADPRYSKDIDRLTDLRDIVDARIKQAGAGRRTADGKGWVDEAVSHHNDQYSKDAQMLELFERKTAQDLVHPDPHPLKNPLQTLAGIAGRQGIGTHHVIGRKAEDAVRGTTRAKTMLAIGDNLQSPIKGSIASEVPGEMLELPYEKEYVKEELPKQATPQKLSPKAVGLDDEWEEVSRGPDSVVEAPEEASTATDIMAPQEPTSIEQKIEETLNPQKRPLPIDLNEKVLNQPLPRDTNRLLQNKEVVRAKIQQLAPDKAPIFEDFLQNDPETFKDAAPKLAMMLPHLFERDKYNTFDGKIVDPMMQEKFLQDLSDDEGMDAYGKSKLALRVRRGESIWEA